jgi:hypothetical protein
MRYLLALALAFSAAAALAGEAWLDARYSDLDGKPRAELRLLRNEVFARHGRTFSSSDLQRHFGRQPWYKPDPGYSDAALSKAERALVDRIEAVERSQSPVDEAERAISAALKAAKAGGGLPDRVGTVAVGKQAPSEPEAASFLGLPGTLGPVISTQGDVVWVAFELPAHGGWDDAKAKDRLVELLRALTGSGPAEDSGGQVWRSGTLALRLIDAGAAARGDSRYSLALHKEDPSVPGGAGDGFKDFLSALQSSLKDGTAAQAAAHFAFPLADDRKGAPLACATGRDFIERFPRFQKELADDEARARLTESGQYAVELGGRRLIVDRVQGTWLVTGLAG